MQRTTAIKRILAFFLALTLIYSCIFLYSCNDSKETESETETGPSGPASATVDILKTGKSDCIVINTGSNVIMIDTGEAENLDTIHAYMREKKYEKIDFLIITHFDKDHIGGASEIISEYEIGTVIESFFFCDNAEYLSYHSAISEKECKIMRLTSNYSFESDGCELVIDVPKSNKYKYDQDNNISLIISMKCGEKRLLFCADALEARLSEFMEGSNVKYDFVKLPHHGSYLENYEDFLDCVNPDYTAITNSKKNPADESTLSLLYGRDILVYQTRYGRVSIATDGTDITIGLE